MDKGEEKFFAELANFRKTNPRADAGTAPGEDDNGSDVDTEVTTAPASEPEAEIEASPAVASTIIGMADEDESEESEDEEKDADEKADEEKEAQEVAEEEREESAKPVEATFAKASTATAYKSATTRSKSKEKESDLSSATEGSLTIDVYQTPTDIIVESAIAGVGPEDIDIEVSTDSVTVRGERQKQHTVSDDDYYYQECYWGRFSRSVILPQEIDPEAASVNFKNGILTIKLPKLNRKKSRKLKVRMD
jgi:HSP20 family protein